MNVRPGRFTMFVAVALLIIAALAFTAGRTTADTTPVTLTGTVSNAPQADNYHGYVCSDLKYVPNGVPAGLCRVGIEPGDTLVKTPVEFLTDDQYNRAMPWAIADPTDRCECWYLPLSVLALIGATTA